MNLRFDMNYQLETKEGWGTYIDCYWESHDMDGEEVYVYPSLPEPYINFYFPIHSNEKARAKGISSEADFFEMRSKLFGVRCYLKGYYQLKLKPVAEISNQIADVEEIGGKKENELIRNISNAESFGQRVQYFQDYFEGKFRQKLSRKEINISEAFQYLISEYQDSKIIQNYAEVSGFSPRTINRWFTKEIGISPKKLCRIARFHTALSGLHSHKEPGNYFDFGYYDQAHFIKEFKEFTSITPEEYFKIVSDLYN